MARSATSAPGSAARTLLAEDLSGKRERIIRTAYRLIGDRGLHGVSLDRVAEVAGVSKGLILYHFKTKENLILATMRWVLSEVAERIRGGMAGRSAAAERILAMIDVIFVGAKANRRFYVTYLDLTDQAARIDRFGELSATFRAIVNGLYADVIRDGVAQGSFRVADIDEAAMTLRAIVDGLFVQWLQEEDAATAHPRYRDTCKRAVLAYLGAGGGAR
ncbi:MAG: TetR family transcriptional regulator C-terminal domain-containing protein [Acidobacteria bacterium]|nr:TetR family transcriptional regulator C-terminal domain-containing protein [Acidobacteriota bacterium]